ncbi:MAG: hypothetical protein CMJ83_00500 [Planctomycetes bacterium]|nr:hypothetical protein [Planctomycetota bacterium]
MNHDRYQELLALRLYDELDDADARALHAHLADCADCRTFENDLASGLGVLATATRPPPDLPEGWTAALEDRIDREPAPMLRPTTWVTAAASFAAGIVLTLLLRGDPATEPRRPEPGETSPAEASSFERSALPAASPTQGRFTVLASLGR